VIEGTVETAAESDTAAESRQPGDTPPPPRLQSDRLGDVARAADRWADEVSRLGGRNTLLRFQELKAGTIDLANAESEARRRLVDGEETLLSALFPHEPLRTSTVRSARAVHAKVRELAEERGIWGGYLAIGIATWAEPYAARRPAVPVLLRRFTIEPTSPVENDFLISVDIEPQVNPVLLLAMATRVGIRLEPDALRDPRGELRYPYVVDRLREHAPAHVVDGFTISHRAVLATFTDTILNTAAALRSEAGRLGQCALPALLAGADVVLPPPGPPVSHRLAFDADDAQAAAVDAAVTSGNHVLLAGPGTGLTQTLANAITALVASGQRVLVVAEPRAPLTDLAVALGRVGLADAVLDLRAEVPESDALAAIRDVVTNHCQAARPEAPQAAAEDQAATLEAYAAWLRTAMAPWWISPYDAQAALVTSTATPVADVGIESGVMAKLHGPALARVREALGELADADGLRASGGMSAWEGAVLDTADDAVAAVDAARRLLRDGLPTARDGATRAAIEVGHAVPGSMAEARSLASLLHEVRETLATFLPEIWQAPLDDLVNALGDHAWRAEHGSPGWFARRRLRRLAEELRLNPRRGPTGTQLQQALVAARDRLARWRAAVGDDGVPHLAEHSGRAVVAVASADHDLALLEAVFPDARLAQLSYTELAQRLTTLVANQAEAHRLPRLRSLHRQLAAAGLAPLVAELTRSRADRKAALATFDRLWYAGVLDALRATDPLAAVEDPDALADRFRTADVRTLSAFAAETQRRYVAGVRAAATADNAATAALADARELSAALHSVRELALAAKPVWLVPTLRVAQTIPADVSFDVTIVEAAHLLAPASAVPALARGRRAIIAGDPYGLSPSAFSVAAEPELEAEDDPPTPGQGPSLLETVRPLLPPHTLTTHYRSADERLVRLAARHLPGSQLAAWPGARRDGYLRHDVVAQTPLSERQEESVIAEVAHVVDLVLDHARNRPQSSLAVVTLGARHAERVRDGVRLALMSAADLEPFFALDKQEPFAVWTVDHVRAEVRDVMIVSAGYGRTAEGRLLYRFGSLGYDGGDRRLVTATTRVRHEMIVVSSFRGEDMNPRRLLTTGPRLLRELLFLAAGTASDELRSAPLAPGLDADIARRLRAAGLPVETGVGYGTLRIPVVLRDPRAAGRRPLAIVTDGVAELASARYRERILPQHLQRLGWSVVRIWSSRWLADPDREVARVREAWHAARLTADVAGAEERTLAVQAT
jgi:REase_MTES_1575